MHARSQQSAASHQPDLAWEMIRRWPGMRGEDKLAWLYLWHRSRGGMEQIDTTPADIAADQNVSSDAGRQRIKNLEAAGLILIVRTDRGTGMRTIEMPLPRDVSRARKITWDGQFEFDFMDSPAESEDVGKSQATSGAVTTVTACAPACDDDMDVRRFPAVGFAEPPFRNRTEVPRSAAEEAPLAHRSSTEEPPLAPEEPPEVPRFEAENDRASRARVLPSKPSLKVSLTSSEPSVPMTFGHLPSSPSRGGDSSASPRGSSGGSSAVDPILLEHEADRIFKRVRCRNLRKAPCLSAARDLLLGEISQHDIEALLENLDVCRRAGKLRAPASAYFNAGMKRIRAAKQGDQEGDS